MYSSQHIPLGMLVPDPQQQQRQQQQQGEQQGAQQGAAAPEQAAAVQVSPNRVLKDMIDSGVHKVRPAWALAGSTSQQGAVGWAAPAAGGCRRPTPCGCGAPLSACWPPPPRVSRQDSDADVLARWFALWAVNAKHGAEALGGSRPDKRGGGGGAPPITGADVELLADEQADRIESEGEPLMTSLRLAAGLVRPPGGQGAALPLRAARSACAAARIAGINAPMAATSAQGRVHACPAVARRVPAACLPAGAAERGGVACAGCRAPRPAIRARRLGGGGACRAGGQPGGGGWARLAVRCSLVGPAGVGATCAHLLSTTLRHWAPRRRRSAPPSAPLPSWRRWVGTRWPCCAAWASACSWCRRCRSAWRR